MQMAPTTMSSFWLPLFVLIYTTITVPGPVNAELSPQVYEELKAEATEVLAINVTSVNNVTAGATDGDNCTLIFTVDAMVLNVNRSVGYSVGDTVEFEAFARDRSTEECELVLGPSPPELLEDGWCGLVYLKPPDDGSELLEPAAYGQSFEEYTAEQCEAAAAMGTSTDPTSGSSLESMYVYLATLISSVICITLVSFF